MNENIKVSLNFLISIKKLITYGIMIFVNI